MSKLINDILSMLIILLIMSYPTMFLWNQAVVTALPMVEPINYWVAVRLILFVLLIKITILEMINNN